MKIENLKLIKKLRHELHQHPEPSNKENWTKNHLIKFLKEHTKLEIVDKGLWFYAIYKSSNSIDNIAFRADFDAVLMDEEINLPHGSKIKGVSHKCGHDGHAASLVGLALEIDQLEANKNIYFLFQHAEETGDGAKECKKIIEDHNISEIFAYHNMSGMPMNSINVIDGTCNFASKGIEISMTGLPSHASEPEKGINPSYAIAKLISSLEDFTSSINNKGIVLSTVIQVDIGERAFGISASKGELLLTIRAQFEDELNSLQNSIEKCAYELSNKYRLKTKISYFDYFPATSNHKSSTDKIRKACKNKGFEIREMKVGFRASEDFGYYLMETKGALCFIGNGEKYPSIHTYSYDFPDEILETSVELFKSLIEID